MQTLLRGTTALLGDLLKRDVVQQALTVIAKSENAAVGTLLATARLVQRTGVRTMRKPTNHNKARKPPPPEPKNPPRDTRDSPAPNPGAGTRSEAEEARRNPKR